MTDQEIREYLSEQENTLANQKIDHSVSPLDNPLKIREVRRNIARVKTILHQREVAAEQQTQE